MPDPIRIGTEALARSADPMTLIAHRLASNQTQSVWPKPDTVSQIQIGSGPVLHGLIQTVCGGTQSSLKIRNW